MDIPAIIIALATFLTALGAFIVSLRNAGRASRAADAAITAAQVASDAKQQIVVVGDNVMEVGKRIDGRLTQLLEITRASAYAEGQLAGPEHTQSPAPKEPKK